MYAGLPLYVSPVRNYTPLTIYSIGAADVQVPGIHIDLPRMFTTLTRTISQLSVNI
jgi:hypothetical protein